MEFLFEKIDGKMTLIQYLGKDKIVKIPDTYKGQNVTVLGKQALANNKFTHITLPKSLEVIKHSCFSGSLKLEEISFPDTLKVIEPKAFHLCVKLINVELPASVEKIGSDCFGRCPNLENVISHNKNIKLGVYPFRESNKIMYANSYLIHGFDLLNAAKLVLVYFLKWSNLEQESKDVILNLINKRSDLKQYLFLLDNVFAINFLLELDLKIDLNEIQSYISAHIENERIDITAKLLDYKNANFSQELINSIKDREELLEIGFELPTYAELKKNWICSKKDGILRISGYKGNDKVATIPASLNDGTKIGALIFSKSNSYEPLESLTIQAEITSLDEKAFYKCETLKKITLPNSIVSIGENAFRQCVSLDEVKLPNSLVNIKKLAFAECQNLKEITIPVNVEDIEDRVFENCKKLEKVEIIGKISRIKTNTFKYCSSLNEVIFPDSLEYINEYAFNSCKNLSEITITKNIKYIQSYAFYDCSNLKKVIFLGPKFEISNFAFNWKTEIVFVDDYDRDFIFEVIGQKVTLTEYRGNSDVVVVPEYYYDEKVVQIGEKVFYNKSKIKEIQLPNSIKYISSQAFFDCYDLQKIVLETENVYIQSNAIGGYTFLESASLELIPNLNSSMQFNLVRNLLINCEDLVDAEKNKLIEIINKIGNLKHELLLVDDSNIHLILNEILLLRLYEISIYLEYHIKKNHLAIIEMLQKYCKEKFSSEEISRWENNKILIESGEVFPELSHFKDDWIIEDFRDEIFIVGYRGALQKQIIPVRLNCGKNITRLLYRNSKTSWELDTLIINAKISCIYNNTFRNAKIRKMVLPESVTRIEDKAFYCSHIVQIMFSKNITNFDEQAFFKCFHLTEIVLPKCLNYIAESCFEYCTNLASISFNESLKRVYTKAFAFCSSLEKVVIPKSVEFLGERVFGDCTALSYVEINANLTKINVRLFENCCNLTEIILPDSLEIIGYEAFRNCTNLQEINIPASVKIIEDRAFLGCEKLKNVNFLGDTPKLGKDVFLYSYTNLNNS